MVELKRALTSTTSATDTVAVVCTVREVDIPNLIASVVDQAGAHRKVSMKALPGKPTAYPAVGERWVISREYGHWMFVVSLNVVPDGISSTALGFTLASNPKFAGGVGASRTDVQNDAALTAAIAGTPAGGTLLLPAGTIQFAGQHTVTNVDLVGLGGSDGLQRTVLQATNAAAQIKILGGGSWSGNFMIDGNSVATLPLWISGGSGANGRTFGRMGVRSSAQDNVLIDGCQNYQFEQFFSEGAARDLTVFDGGTGGHQFLRCEFAGSGRYHHRFDTLIDNTPYGDYPYASDIDFISCIMEGTVGTSHVYMVNGFNIKYDGTEFYSANQFAGPMVDIVGGTAISFGNAHVQMSPSGPYLAGSRFLRVRNNAIVGIFGRMNVFFIETVVEPYSVTCLVDDKAFWYLTSCGNRSYPANGANFFSQGGRQGTGLIYDVQYQTSDGTGNNQPIWSSFTYLLGALLSRQDANGTLYYYPGNNFTSDTSFGRRAAGAVGVPSGTQQVLITGAGTTTQRPTPSAAIKGAVYANLDTLSVELCDGTAWRSPSDLTWTAATVVSGVSGDTTHPPASYAKTRSGLVVHKGIISGITLDTTLYTLPAGMRPVPTTGQFREFNVWGFNGASQVLTWLRIDSSGNVTVHTGGNYVDLGSLPPFYAEA